MPPRTFQELLNGAGAGPVISDYLESRGLTRPGTLALVATAEPDFERHVVAPLLAGYTKNGTCHKVEQEEAPVARAMLLHMWLEARKDWNETLLPSPAAAPVATHSVAAQPAPADDKPPKTFPQWAKQIEAYNSKLLGAKRRRFPEMQLAGAEQILAKLWHMHTRTKQYEPPGLGEVIQARTFTASRDVNPLREKKHASKGLRIEDDTLVPKEDPQWEPRSVLSVLDGLEATKWALIRGEEEHIEECVSWFMAKPVPSQLELNRFVSIGSPLAGVFAWACGPAEPFTRRLKKSWQTTAPWQRPLLHGLNQTRPGLPPPAWLGAGSPLLKGEPME